RPFAKGRPVTRAGQIGFAVANGVAVPAWTLLGVILWASPSPACQIAGAGFMAGHLLYIQAHYCHSPGALLTSLPAVVAPAIVPLMVPHFTGADQVIVTVSMLAVFSNALVSIYVSLTRSKALMDAQHATEAA